MHEDGDEEDLDEDEMLEALENNNNAERKQAETSSATMPAAQVKSGSSPETAEVASAADADSAGHAAEENQIEDEEDDGYDEDELEEEEEEEVEWKIEGHEWIGKTVVRVFGEHERTTATCTKWAEADSEGPALWHVVSGHACMGVLYVEFAMLVWCALV